MTSVGRCTLATTFAMVKVLPEPVTPEQGLVRVPAQHALGQLADGPRLVALRLVVADDLEVRHGPAI